MAIHHQLRAVVEQHGEPILHDSDNLRRALEAHPDAAQTSEAERDLVAETVRWGGLPRLTDAVNRGTDPRSAITATGEEIARDRGSADVEGTRWALASLAYAAGRLPESEAMRFAPQPGYPQEAAYDYPAQDAPTGQQTGTVYGPPPYGYGAPPAGSSGRSRSPLIIAIAAGVVLLLAVGGIVLWLVTADESYDEAAYCDAYRQGQEQLSNFDVTSVDSAQFDALQQEVERIKELAPPQVADDWETIDEALEEFESILDDADLTADDLGDVASGQIPEGLDPDELLELSTRLREFTSRTDFAAAGRAVNDDAETRCS
jgi:hypothetical protein